MSDAGVACSSWFQEHVPPGFAFKAVVIGGGYAPDREDAEFLLSAGAWGGPATVALNTAICHVLIRALALLGLYVLIAERVGLVALIAGGYRLLAWVILAVYVLPLATLGVWRLVHRSAPILEAA